MSESVEDVEKASPKLEEKLITEVDEDGSPRIFRPSVYELAKPDFYKSENWFDVMCEILFKIKTRKTTIKAEIYFGLIHFISCLYCLAVIPQQLKAAGYGSRATVVSVAACSGVGSIICGLFANLPFVLAPPTVVSIFLSVSLQQNNGSRDDGNMAVIISGIVLLLFGWKPLFRFVAHLIPISIQVGCAVGIGLLTALAGSTEIDLVVKGDYTILEMGKINPEIAISFAGIALTCVAMVYHVKGAFCIAVIVCSLIWWIYDNDFPGAVFAAPQSDTAVLSNVDYSGVPLLTGNLVFLYILYLNGLVTSLSNLAYLTREDGSAPRGRWIFIMSGVFTIIGGLLSAPPILISPESAASIKAGAKTGLSTVVCGVLFCLSLFLSPVFENVPPAGTSPILIMIGVILQQNVARVDWRNIKDAAPAFIVLFYIPFTYSVIQGVVMGYIVYLIIALSSGELRESAIQLAVEYFPAHKDALLEYSKQPQKPLSEQPRSDQSDAGDDGAHGGDGLALSSSSDRNTRENRDSVASANGRSNQRTPSTAGGEHGSFNSGMFDAGDLLHAAGATNPVHMSTDNSAANFGMMG